MSWRSWRGLGVTAALLAGLVTATPANSVAAAPGTFDSAFDSGPARDALVRLVGADRANQVTLRAIDRGEGDDRFAVSAAHGKVVIAGTTPAVQLTGFGYYLRHVAHADIAINGSQTDLPTRLPLPSAPIERDSSVDHRFALNDTNQGYAGPFLSWTEWQRRIDVLALHGINEVLLYEGQEAVYQRTFTEFGYSAQDMREWIPQPAHQAWWLLQNMCCTGSPISQQLIDQRARLGRKMADRLRSLGMTPVLPGYFGTVPTDFETRNPGAHTVPQGTWNRLERPDWLAPTDPLFARVAARFYRVQTDLFGTSTMYKMDLLHEGGKAGDVDVPDASRAVQKALNDAHPNALWTILGWQRNPLPATLQAIDRSKMFVVDGITEKPNITDRDRDFLGAEYAFGTIWNFGGHTNFGAGLTVWNEKFHAWLDRPGTKMNGIALMPEAIDNNPAAVAFFADMPWVDGPVDVDRWFADYATARYGAADPHATAAWRIVANTAYSWPAGADTVHVTGLFSDRPGLGNTGTKLQYDIAAFDKALGELLLVAPALRDNDAYRYDLVDVARQVLANHSRVDLPKIRTAYAAGDEASFAHLTKNWLDRIALLDRLLGTNEHFLLGTWQREARAQAADDREAAALDYDLKSLITLWATGTDLQDYARREFNGLVGDYYAHRWRLYFDSLATALDSGTQPAPIDWLAVAEEWSNAGTRFPDRPRGDSYAVAAEVAALPSGELTLGVDHKGVRPGGVVSVTAEFTNTNQLRASGALTAELSTPDGYRVTPVTPPSTGSVAAAGTFSVTWDVAVPSDASAGTVDTLTATAAWDGETTSADTAVLVGGEVGAPYRTAASTHAVFAQHGDEIGIAAGGDDMWAGSNEYATAYRPDVLADDHAVATTVSRQHGSSPYTRSGLVAGNDLSAAAPGGYANIAVTPGHGCMFSWDSDADGRLDRYTEVGGFAPEVRVRLAKSGTRLTGSCSSDGRNWTVVGSGTVPDAASSVDVGLFVSAVNRNTGQEAIATFTGGIAEAPSTARDGSGDTVQSVGKPVTALDFENGRPPTAANDGSRANNPYWGGPLTLGSTWWQVDLGAVNDVSRVNVRNYVDGTRYYTYRLEGSLDGRTWFTLGGRAGPRPASDAGDTADTEARARYVRVVGQGNTANGTFHLTEVTVYGTPVP
ncbi:alpha-N-acetylglucosaminidase TIM-barrel domain-containing protein [Actinophytocola sp. NPDC049390]|uniref:alpha-N-acetylglucosaminidase TIM-barrel domain-containing protein n=1 Tax=Actinophytocola sp. NPDC049390 TaxID=3363894 RepID=UPI0037A1AEBC